jgi:hypothetical protein
MSKPSISDKNLAFLPFIDLFFLLILVMITMNIGMTTILNTKRTIEITDDATIVTS